MKIKSIARSQGLRRAFLKEIKMKGSSEITLKLNTDKTVFNSEAGEFTRSPCFWKPNSCGGCSYHIRDCGPIRRSTPVLYLQAILQLHMPPHFPHLHLLCHSVVFTRLWLDWPPNFRAVSDAESLRLRTPDFHSLNPLSNRTIRSPISFTLFVSLFAPP